MNVIKPSITRISTSCLEKIATGSCFLPTIVNAFEIERSNQNNTIENINILQVITSDQMKKKIKD